MTDTLKVLGQSNPPAATLTTLYTVPAVTTTTVSSLMVCNRGGTTAHFRISVAVGGAADDPSQYLYYDVPLNGNDTFSAVVGVTLATTDVIRVQTDTATLSFSAFGVQLT